MGLNFPKDNLADIVTIFDSLVFKSILFTLSVSATWEKEKLKLAMAVAEDDVDMWLTHHSLEIQFLDGSLHACFVGYPKGAGGLDFKYFCSFKTYQSMLETISQEPISFLD